MDNKVINAAFFLGTVAGWISMLGFILILNDDLCFCGDVSFGVDELNLNGLCGVIVVSDHSTRGALARWGAGNVRPGRPLKPAKMIFRFSHKTMCALITSGLRRLDRHHCPNCRFHGGETSLADGETGNSPGYIVSL